MVKNHQFIFSIFSICLVFILGLSSVNKTIHNRIFHPNFSTEYNTASSGCSGSHEGGCKTSGTQSNPQNCDASCPVNVFANGILALDYIPEITPQILSNSEVAIKYLITNLIEDEKNSNLVRGPPYKSRNNSTA